MDRRDAVKSAVIVVLLVAIAAAAFGVIHYLDTKGSKSNTEDRDTGAPEPITLYLGDLQYEVTDNIKTYLISGTDGAGSKPNAKHYQGPSVDYLLLLVIDKTKETHGYIEIDRDTICDIARIPEGGDEDLADIVDEQILTATWYGKDLHQGLSNLNDSTYNLLGGLPIDGYYSVNMDHIDKINHAVGGVTVTIEDDFSEYDEEMVPGATVHLNDKQAELFVRGRMEVGDGTNESRMRRQSTYMEALMKQCREKMSTDKTFANELWDEMSGFATTNIPGNRVSSIANLIYKTKDLGIYDIEGEHTKGRLQYDEQDYAMFYADEESIVKIFNDLIGLGEGKEYD